MFTLAMQSWFNIQKEINVIHHTNGLKKQKSHDDTSICNKTLSKLGIKGDFSLLEKGHLQQQQQQQQQQNPNSTSLTS